MKIVMIGAGNVATHLGLALVGAGHEVMQVWSRTASSAQMLAARLGCESVTLINDVRGDADVYIMSVVDDALAAMVPTLCRLSEDALFLHTAGSVSKDCFKGYAKNYGVVYPLQTFSKDKALNFRQIPVFFEASNEPSRRSISSLAKTVSDRVYVLDEEGRKWLHLAAVFACNFSNYCCTVAEMLLQKKDIPFDVMLPLFDETASKLHHLSPKAAQTGPASRNDSKVMEGQMAMLADNMELQDIYKLLSKGIIKNSKEVKMKNNDKL